MSVHPIRPLSPEEARRLSPTEKLTRIKSEITAQLEDRIEELNIEAQKMTETMSQIHVRTMSQGFRVELEDLKTGRWYRLSAEITTLQEIAAFIEGVDAY